MIGLIKDSTFTHFLPSSFETMIPNAEQILTVEHRQPNLATSHMPHSFISNQDSSMHINSSNSEASAKYQRNQDVDKSLF